MSAPSQPKPIDAGAAPAAASTSADPKGADGAVPQLGALEEDDEFEEFAEQGPSWLPLFSRLGVGLSVWRWGWKEAEDELERAGTARTHLAQLQLEGLLLPPSLALARPA